MTGKCERRISIFLSSIFLSFLFPVPRYAASFVLESSLAFRLETAPEMKTMFITFLMGSSILVRAAQLAPVVEIEEDVYSYTNANNGAGPMWCSGSTSLVRSQPLVPR